MKGLLGRKLGMTQVFTTDGTLIPVTVVEVVPNVVMQKKTIETDGYEAIQLGMEDVSTKRANKPAIGHAAKANTTPKRFIREVRGNEMFNFEVGSEVKADLFSAGDIVDVTGVSKGHGFSGTIVRNNAKLGPASHGSGHHRHIGSLATIGRNNSVINKGTMMAGQHGNFTTTNQNLEVIKVDVENNYMLIKGNVPGARRSLVEIKTTVKPIKNVKAKELISYVVEEAVVEEEVIAPVEEVVENTVVEEAVVAEEAPVVEEAPVSEEAAVEETVEENVAPAKEEAE